MREIEAAPNELLPTISRHHNPAKNPKTLSDSPIFPNRFIELSFRHNTCSVSPQRALYDLPTPGTKDPGLDGRIFIIEIGHPDVTALADLIPPEVLRKHLHGRDGSPLPVSIERDDVFSVYWPRLVRQEPDIWKEEERIRTGKLWNIDTYRNWDPSDLVQNHRRHYPWPECPNRGYDFIFEGTIGLQSGVFHAAHECISLFNTSPDKGSWTGYLLVDPIRYHRVFDIEYGETEEKDTMKARYRRCFIEDSRPIERFKEAIQNFIATDSDIDRGYPATHWVKVLVSRIIHDDIAEVLGAMSKSLDQIELSLHDDHELRDSVALWRERLARWRNTIFRQERLIRTYLATGLRLAHSPPEAFKRLDGDLIGLEIELRESRLRIDNVFQSLMSAMSIVESHKAIEQAEGVSKLTQLAFFFIPLSLVATVFGMNVTEFTDKLTWISWVITSITVMTLTYLVVYRKEFLNWTRHTFQLITSQKSKGLRKLAVLKIQSNRLAYAFSALTVLALIGVGTWRLAISDLSIGSRIAIGICVVWAPILVCSVVLYSAWVPVSGLHGALRKRRRRLSSFSH
ncbi:cora-like Mg2+ transporter protein-domain-containing protein [Cercophora newfieldiana]|uniref:Cora-like Mg2+ transporter protein-domain-containing protein n=1 Tax=Cercophora newfieldiana TaxID=92897 RepID=A0AA40CX73_9PEZI|nr:cora-like Mg2+ transporter protein-domain-containing protein [Cercophora newfieldiana]